MELALQEKAAAVAVAGLAQTKRRHLVIMEYLLEAVDLAPGSVKMAALARPV